MRTTHADLRNVFPLLTLCAALLLLALPADAELRAGAAQTDITPPVGTPSAGYGNRRGRGMEGVHDPLLATALVIDNGETMIAFVGVDHLGYDAAMVESLGHSVATFEGSSRNVKITTAKDLMLAEAYLH